MEMQMSDENTVKSCVKAQKDGVRQRTRQGPEQCKLQRTGWGIRQRNKGGNSILPTSIYLVRARPLDEVGRIKMGK